MNDATTNPDALPLPSEQDVLTNVLRQGASRLLAQAIQAEVAGSGLICLWDGLKSVLQAPFSTKLGHYRLAISFDSWPGLVYPGYEFHKL